MLYKIKTYFQYHSIKNRPKYSKFIQYIPNVNKKNRKKFLNEQKQKIQTNDCSMPLSPSMD